MWLAAAVFSGGVFWISATRWATFGYRTFDLAFYIQALWRLIHGHADTVTLLNLPLLAGHADVVVFFLAPLFWLLPHPLLPVAVQTLALASMAPVGYRIARRLGLEPGAAGLMALATLLTPATGFVALHEFHPEAFTAPFLLLAIDAWQRQSLPRFWLWFLAVLACKENMTLLLAAWCGVNAWTAWRGAKRSPEDAPRPGFAPWSWKWCARWCVAPAVAALGWAVIYAGVITPCWNAGNVDFTQLYGRWFSPDVPWTRMPQALCSQLQLSLSGNLLPGLLLPLCGLSLLRPRWLLVAAPVALQHLLSFRSSEWNIYFHYPAPLLPLFWIAACEAVAGFSMPQVRRGLACAVAVACVAAQVWIGPFHQLTSEEEPGDSRASLEEKRATLASIPENASVVAGLPYLSHLAKRDALYSLHHLLKGLKTLSLKPYQPPPPVDVVVVDYADSATFDPGAGYYHPTMRVVGGLIVPSSDLLLHTYLRQAAWEVENRNALTVFRRRSSPPSQSQSQEPPTAPPWLAVSQIDPATTLVDIRATCQPGSKLRVESRWRFDGERKAIPWMKLRLSPARGGANVWLERGLCAPEGWNNGTLWTDRWLASLPGTLTPGFYRMEAVFFDNARWREAQRKTPGAGPEFTAQADLGFVEIR